MNDFMIKALLRKKISRLQCFSYGNLFVAATYPILFLYSQNIDEVAAATVGSLIAISLLMALMLLVLTRFLLGNVVSAGFVISIWLILFFSYGYVLDAVAGLNVGGFVIGRVRYLLIFEFMIAAVVLWIGFRRSDYCERLTPILTIFLITPLMITILTMGVHYYPGQSSTIYSNMLKDDVVEGKASVMPVIDTMPDIYYIILDSYPREDVLKEIHGFDNSEFINHLKSNGFFIAKHSAANYTQTSLSLASSLNMGYLQDILNVNKLDEETNQSILKDLIRDNKAIFVTKSLGYRFGFLSSQWGLTTSNQNADIKLSAEDKAGGIISGILTAPLLSNDFVYYLSRTMIIRHGIDRVFNLVAADLFLTKLEILNNIPNIKYPKFIFVHFIPPHPPYIFDRDGNVSESGFFTRSYTDKQAYLEQLMWVNKSIETTVDNLLSKSRVPPVIILQGDHGTEFTDVNNVMGWGGVPEDVLVREKTGILNAYYLPDMCDKSNLYDSITPVNSFRMVLDSCFGTDFGLLEDQLFWSTYDKPYKFRRSNVSQINPG